MSLIGNTARFIAGLAVGGAVGTLTAMLLAPQEGEMSRSQLQSRLDTALAAGRRAARQREEELYTAWEGEVGEQEAIKKERKADDKPDIDTEAARAEEKARRTAHEAEDKARAEAQKHLEQANKELEKARHEVEKADKAD